MSEFRPFMDDAASVSLEGLTIENGTVKIALYGDLDITRDAAGLDKARRLQAHLAAIVAALEAGAPAATEAAEAPFPVENPFS